MSARVILAHDAQRRDKSVRALATSFIGRKTAIEKRLVEGGPEPR